MNIKGKIIFLDRHYRFKIIRVLFFFLFIYALGSVFISSPFMVRAYSHSPINYSTIMYAHGLTVGLASIISLIVCRLFEMDEKIRGYILLLSVFGVLIGILAGAFNKSITPPYWLWFQVLSFFCLDGIYLLLIIGFVFNKNTKIKWTINYWTALICSVILLFAGITGDIAGWIMDFGNNPPLIGIWANFMGYEKISDLMGRLIFTHSHLMVVSLLTFLTVIFSFKFGRGISGPSLVLRLTGESLVLLGTLGMALLYTLAGYGRPEMKSMLTDAKAYLHGLAFTELCVGIGVLYGGLIILISVLI